MAWVVKIYNEGEVESVVPQLVNDANALPDGNQHSVRMCLADAEHDPTVGALFYDQNESSVPPISELNDTWYSLEETTGNSYNTILNDVVALLNSNGNPVTFGNKQVSLTAAQAYYAQLLFTNARRDPCKFVVMYRGMATQDDS